MASINKIEPGQILYKAIKRKMGNTSQSCTDYLEVQVISVDLENAKTFAKVGANLPRNYSEQFYKQWRVSKPKIK